VGVNDREREKFEFERIELVERMEHDWGLIADYRENEKYYINRLVKSATRLGTLNERLA
jgi:hypothetical protein